MKTLFLFLFACLLCFSACVRKGEGCDDDDVYKFITPAQKNHVPYGSNDTLRFKTNSGDTMVFYCLGKDSAVTLMCMAGPISCTYKFYAEANIWTFYTIDSMHSFVVKNDMLCEDPHENLISFKIDGRQDVEYWPYPMDIPHVFYDSVVVNGKYYKGLNIWYKNDLKAGFYTLEFGITQLILNGKTYTYYE